MCVNGFWYCFRRNVTDKVSNQKILYNATSKNLCFCTTWKTGNTKTAFVTRCISALPEFNQLLLDFFNLFDSRLILILLYDSVNLQSMLSAWGCWGMIQEKRSRERCSSWTVLHAQCTSALSSGFPLSQGNTEALDTWGGKQSIVWFLTFSVTLLPKLSQSDCVRQDCSKSKVGRIWDTVCKL